MWTEGNHVDRTVEELIDGIVSTDCFVSDFCVSHLQDCHVLTFSSTGSVSDHLVLHPQLATGNFIIKAIWLPGSQTELAIITADFVKVNFYTDDFFLFDVFNTDLFSNLSV